MKSTLKNIKKSIKGHLKFIRLGYVRRRYAFSVDQFQYFLQQLGIRNGDVLLVHSSMSGFEGFDGKVTDIISVLQKSVGTEGTLLMPTIPFMGTAIEYMQAGKIFDVRRTPSRMGMISEFFRRMPEVKRSVHPTHSVAAWGARVNDILLDHDKCETPCGRQSPYGKLLDFNGKILLLGTGIRALTFYHTLEEIFEKEIPVSPLTDKKYLMQSKTETGELVTTKTRLFNPAVSKRRNIDPLIPELKSMGYWREYRVGTLSAILLDANEILKVMMTMCSNGQYCYD